MEPPSRDNNLLPYLEDKPVPADYSMFINYFDDVERTSKCYRADSIDDVRPEHQTYVALLTAMPLDTDKAQQQGPNARSLSTIVPTAKLWNKSHTLVVAFRQDWAGVANIWLQNISEFDT